LRRGTDSSAAQDLVSHHYWVIEGQLEPFSPPFRYVWPSELDLMARMADTTLRERCSGWNANRSPATAPCTSQSGRKRR